MATATFAIGGMHCAACAVRNERTLRKIPGVRDANVNLGTRRARVEFDEAAVSEPALRKAITENGYEVSADESGDHRQQVRAEVRAARLRALSAVALATPVVVLAMADVELPKERLIPLAAVQDFANVAGKGVRGRLEDNAVAVGNLRLMTESGVAVEGSLHQIENCEAHAQTAIAVACNGEVIGIIAVADTLKSDAEAAIRQLRADGITPIMITGDNKTTAEAVAGQIGIDQVFAEVLPQEKAERVKALQSQGRRVAFVGDGINDAPALVQADLGIAIGTGTDIAIEAGNIVLVKGSPLKIIEALKLSRLTFKTVKQNLFWAFVYNIAAVPLAAFGLLNPMIAAGAMAISSVSVVGNSLRIRRQKLT